MKEILKYMLIELLEIFFVVVAFLATVYGTLVCVELMRDNFILGAFLTIMVVTIGSFIIINIQELM